MSAPRLPLAFAGQRVVVQSHGLRPAGRDSMIGKGRSKVKFARVGYLALLLCSPLVAQAQVYKCKQADGSLHFQSSPCPAGASSSTVAMPPAAREPARGANQDSTDARKTYQIRKSPQELAQEKDRQRAEQESKRYNDEVKAYNRAQRCNHARQQLGVVKAGRPAYRLDNAGDRHYIEDQNRAAEIAAAEQRVAAECQ